MRVAVLHHYSLTYGGGGEKIIQSIANELARRGHEVCLYSIPIRRGPNYRIPNNIKHYYESLFRRVDADIAYVVYAPLIMRTLFCIDSPRIAGIHSFLPCSSFALEQSRAGDFIWHHGLLATMAFAAWKVYGNKDLHQYDALHIPNLFNPLKFIKKPVYTIPNWIDSSVFKPKKEKEDVFTVAFVGRPLWQKGWDIYEKISEFFIAYKSIRDMNFIAVGGSSNKHKHIKSLGYVSSDEELSEIYSSSHVVVYPSRADIFGLTTLEALSCGTPVVTSSLPSHATFLPCDFLCKTISCYVARIYEIYKKWKKDKESYEELSKKCRKIAIQFDKSKIFPKFERMLFEVAYSGG